MTRDEALAYFKRRKDMGLYDICQQAEDMAISALQEPKYRMAYDYSDRTVHKFAWINNGWKELAVEPCEDAISRDAVLEKMADYVASGYADSADDFEEYSKIICELPSVTPSRRKGHWIQLDYQRGKFECSECHTQGYVDTCMYEPTWKYCPCCGAEMESEE